MRWNADAGWVAVPGALSRDEVTAVLDAVAQLLALEPDQRHPRDKPASGTRHVADLHVRLPLVDDVLLRLEPVVAEVLGEVFTVDVSYRSPQPGFGAQKLHTDDIAKLDDGPERGMTAIVTLCDFNVDNGTTRLVPGSHRRPDLQRLGGNLDAHDDEQRLTGAAGTAFLFSAHVLHSGTRNDSDSERPALQICWRRH